MAANTRGRLFPVAPFLLLFFAGWPFVTGALFFLRRSKCSVLIQVYREAIRFARASACVSKMLMEAMELGPSSKM